MKTRMMYISMKNRNVKFRPHNGPKDPNQTIFRVNVTEGEIGTVHLPHQINDSAVFIVDSESRNVLANRGKLIRSEDGQPIQVIDMRPLPTCTDVNFDFMVEMQGKQKHDFTITMEALVAEFVPDAL